MIGFPHGDASATAKAAEAARAVADGADELDVVIAIGALKEGDHRAVYDDLRGVVHAADGKPVKVILETALLDEREKVVGCVLSKAAGAAFVKTSTGYAKGGATVEDIALMRRVVGPDGAGADHDGVAVGPHGVGVGPGGASLVVDTVAADTAFDPILQQLTDVGVYDPNLTDLADDTFDCTFAPLDFQCPAGELAEGVYEVAVGTWGSCTGVTAGYTFFVEGDATFLPVLDDTPFPFAEADFCSDAVDNDGNGDVDCGDAACAADPACIVP